MASERTYRITHELKTWPEFYAVEIRGQKRFEVRRNDRDFKVGDELLLKEWDPKEHNYTGRSCLFRVDYLMTAEDCKFIGLGWDGPPLQDGYVIMSISWLP